MWFNEHRSSSYYPTRYPLITRACPYCIFRPFLLCLRCTGCYTSPKQPHSGLKTRGRAPQNRRGAQLFTSVWSQGTSASTPSGRWVLRWHTGPEVPHSGLKGMFGQPNWSLCFRTHFGMQAQPRTIQTEPEMAELSGFLLPATTNWVAQFPRKGMTRDGIVR